MKQCLHILITAVAVVGLVAQGVRAEPSKNFKVFLCFGQSNISGGAGVGPGEKEKQTTDRVMALAFNTCGSPSWQKDAWVPAREPLHCGDQGVGDQTMGPVYVFGKIMADSLPDDTIGLIPCGQSGVNIEVFVKGGGGCTADWCVPYPGGNVYNWMLEKCKKATQRGVLSGIFLHQGESNRGKADWLNKIKQIYNDLKTDLNLEKDIPLVAGELLYAGEGNCSSPNSCHNPIIADIPKTLPFGYVASAEGLSGGGTYASLHFNQDGYRTLAQRYAVEMMKGLRDANVITSSKQQSHRQPVVSAASIASMQNNVNIYTLNGKLVSTGTTFSKTYSVIKPGNIYLVANKTTGATTKLMIAPSGR